MNKGSMMFKMICAVLCFALCLVSLPVFAEETAQPDEEATAVTEEIAAPEEEEIAAPEENEEAEEATDFSEEVGGDAEEFEPTDLYSAVFRDNGIYITPGEENATVFEYNSLKYRVNAGAANYIKLGDGFEEDVTVWTSPISSAAKNTLQANAQRVPEAAHSGYFGLSVSSGDVIYRTAVTGGDIYVFSMWVNMPASGSIGDIGRAFRVTGESGGEYIVGYNEIGRDEALTDGWQQVIFTFKAPDTGLFAINFNYRDKGKNTLYLDDIELYEAEIFDNPLDIRQIECVEPSGKAYTYETKFAESGVHTHRTVLYNNSEDDVYFTAVMVLYRNDIMVDFKYSEECALVLDEAEVEFEIDIPDEGNVSEYKYMVYFISENDITAYYGPTQTRTNPYVVQGK